jgi:hypothetical protein
VGLGVASEIAHRDMANGEMVDHADLSIQLRKSSHTARQPSLTLAIST